MCARLPNPFIAVCFFAGLAALSQSRAQTVTYIDASDSAGDNAPGIVNDTENTLRVVTGSGTDDAGSALCIDDGVPFHRTTNFVTDARLIGVPGSTILLALWMEVLPDKQLMPFYAISLDGQSTATVRRTSYMLRLRHGDFDPGAGVPPVATSLASDDNAGLYIVQFVTQPLEAFRKAIEDLGGTVYHYLAHHAHIVQMTPDVRNQAAALPFVRWVGPYHPAYRLEEILLEGLKHPGMLGDAQRYHIQVFKPGPDQKKLVAARIRAVGGKVMPRNPGGVLLDAVLAPAQLLEIARMDEVLFVDRWLPQQMYMNNVREDGGANHVETVGGYTGEGVRAEVLDSGLQTSHPAFQARPPIIHNCNSSDTWHGTSTYGINFGDGTGNGDGRGLVPDAQGIFSATACLTDRHQHTMELVQGPYYAVYQTNSWGWCCTTEYGTEAMEMDRIIFDTDLLILQAQANEGGRSSDVSAWAKNVVSVGGIRHYDTLSRADDQWAFAGSIGPAADGRVKPDLSYWYDGILTTTDNGGYMTDFGGTSGATPETAGHFGLFFQMWADGIFGNEVDPAGTVFENRCHAATAKAVLINTALQYPFTGTSHDLTRVHQGWGTADVEYLYDMRAKISVIDETDVLANLETATYSAYVEPGEPALRATMVYSDPPGTTSSSQHRINDLTLKLTSPSDTVYWGNNGLAEGEWSTSGGDPNTIDTVENVFVENPETGLWTVEVVASEINQDSHVETPELDADFALVVSGALLSSCTSQGRVGLDAAKYACTDQATISVVDCDLNTDDEAVETVNVLIDSDTEPGGETVLLTETGPATANFRATVDLSTVDAVGVLQVSEGDVTTATYVDADDGQGGVNVVVTDTAVVDCTPPQISNVQATDIDPWNATVIFDTNEPARGSVRYGSDCGTLTEAATAAGFQTSHTVNLAGLDDDGTYFYAVDAEDEAGNASSDDNGGGCYSFTTPDVPDYFTEQFSDDLDLGNKTVTFQPDGSLSFYRACTEEASVFPTDPTGGTVLSLGDDDYAAATLSSGETVSLYGTSYDTFYVGSNGYITFTAGDTEYWETLSWHFDLPRISGLFVDLDPSSGGAVSWKQLSDRVAVTWENVPQYGTSNSNSFQIESFFDGMTRLTWLLLEAPSGISGLSAGEGLPADFAESDLSAYGICDCLVIAPSEGLSSSGYEGGPFTPDCVTYTLTNNCDSSLDWTAAGVETWVDADPPGGTLPASSSAPVDLCINANANSLPPDTYNDTVTFTNIASGVTQDRDVTLEVVDHLVVTPTDDFTSAGEEGGPFEPECATYTLTNNGSTSLNWTAGVVEAWLDVNPPGGTLAVSDFTTVDVCINTNANVLAPGVYIDTATFTNESSGIDQTREVELTVWEPCVAPPAPANPDPPHDATSVPVDTDLAWDAGGPTVSVDLPSTAGYRPAAAPAYLPDARARSERPATTLEITGGYRVTASPMTVLLLASGTEPTILRTALVAFPDVASMDYFDASLATPTVGALAAYDAVVAMSNSSYFDSVATGDALADYVDGGGKVVQAVATFATGGGWELAGRFVTAGSYEPFAHGGPEFLPHSLGAFDAGHPIMAGVTALTDGLPAGVSVQTGAGWVADWDNGAPLVATRDNGVVGINIFAFDDGDYTGDVALLFHNALVWLIGGQSPCPTTYDVYFGTDNPPTSLICDDISTRECDPGPLSFLTTYHWQVVAGTSGGETPSPVWSFTTMCEVAERPTAAEDWNSTTLAMTGSATCTSNADCPQTSQCIDNVCYFTYNRYLYLHPNNSGQSVALRVKHVASGATRWVDSDTQQVVHNNNDPALLTYAFTHPDGSAPDYAAWPDQPVGVTGCFIVPGEEYEIQALTEGCDPASEADYSSVLSLPTAIFGDVISTLTPPGPSAFAYPPQGPLVDVMDMTAIVACFGSENWTSKMYCDLIGLIDNPSFNNVVVDVSDMTVVVNAFGGDPYPGMPPSSCP